MKLASVSEYSDEAFEGLNEQGAEIKDSRFENCTFKSCTFSESSFRGTSFIDCKFDGCDLSNAQLTNARFRDIKFQNCKMLGINCSTTAAIFALAFERCVINFSVFESLDLRRSVIEN